MITPLLCDRAKGVFCQVQFGHRLQYLFSDNANSNRFIKKDTFTKGYEL